MTSILSSDRPQTDPSRDLFGYAPFAQTLTKAICNHRSSDPLVLGLYGAWGSGKSTILKFICHNLKAVPEKERPIVIEFNPWWFSGQEHLARAFLDQLQAVLPKKDDAFKELGVLLGNFSEIIGGGIDAVAQTGGFGKKVGSLVKSIFNRPPQDVPALKEKICTTLQKSEKHIVIMIDDIDRLEAEEIRQLFTVIKALADFPNVIYLLAFDQAVVVRAIEKCSDMPGQAYLEKIIQASFVVPLVDRTILLNGLEKRLNEILKGTPEYLFERSHWISVLYNGLDKFFTVPRNIVRFCNTLSVTYPAVRGEVNAVDFIVIEAIRFFLPELYMYIRENQNEFVGTHSKKSLSYKKLINILDTFVPEDMRQNMGRILKLLFPYIANNHFVHQHYARRTLPIGDSEFFSCYFCFNPSSNTISNSEILQWLEKAGDADAFGSVLLQAKDQGLLQVHIHLGRLRDHVEEDIQEKDIPVVIGVLLDIGDELIESPYDAYDSFTIVNNSDLVTATVEMLGRRLPLDQRLSTLEHAIQDGSALAVQCFLLGDSEMAIEEGREPLIPQEELQIFKTLLLAKFDECITNKTLLCHQNLMRILNIWSYWSTDTSKIRNWCTEVTKTDDGMLTFIKKFICSRQYLSEGVTITHHIKPQSLEPYIDVAACEKRILILQEEGRIPQEYEETATLFLQGVELWRKGKTPENTL
ncbi:P-loop NTPase fold protein [Desulfovibrio sp. ZJ200]|uniref:KAP family P-loop NTPase fold protein n=1 Tax=Desulfovibrio sp. ZJ200 TaxID=2709792 RepID=UPI0013EAE1B5|nr:P-loop NTPase fold protein [Desulfovibrio sp. ZJ200]